MPEKKAPLQEILMTDIMRTSALLDHKLNSLFKNFDISPSQYNILRILRGAENKTLTASAVKERMINPKSDATRLIDKLVIKKIVKRTICPTNRRVMEISITKEGLSLLDKIEAKLSGNIKSYGGDLISIDESERFVNYLTKLREQIQNVG